MDHTPSDGFGKVPQNSEGFRTVPQPAESVGNLPNHSEPFGKIPNASEHFRTVRNTAERTESHTLTVREVARLFEHAGVPRTERSIVNWCRNNRQGVARLDAFFDENDGRYLITPSSVTRAIEEERAKQTSTSTTQPNTGSTSAEKEIPKHSEKETSHHESDNARIKELERQNRDLEITTRAKDYYIEQLTKERGQFHEQLLGMSRHVGKLETQILQLGAAPRADNSLPHGSETDGAA